MEQSAQANSEKQEDQDAGHHRRPEIPDDKTETDTDDENDK